MLLDKEQDKVKVVYNAGLEDRSEVVDNFEVVKVEVFDTTRLRRWGWGRVSQVQGSMKYMF